MKNITVHVTCAFRYELPESNLLGEVTRLLDTCPDAPECYRYCAEYLAWKWPLNGAKLRGMVLKAADACFGKQHGKPSVVVAGIRFHLSSGGHANVELNAWILRAAKERNRSQETILKSVRGTEYDTPEFYESVLAPLFEISGLIPKRNNSNPKVKTLSPFEKARLNGMFLARQVSEGRVATPSDILEIFK